MDTVIKTIAEKVKKEKKEMTKKKQELEKEVNELVKELINNNDVLENNSSIIIYDKQGENLFVLKDNVFYLNFMLDAIKEHNKSIQYIIYKNDSYIIQYKNKAVVYNSIKEFPLKYLVLIRDYLKQKIKVINNDN